MSYLRLLLYFLLCGFISCEKSKKKGDELVMAKQYYNALDDSSHSKVKLFLTDSITTIVKDYDYKQTFSQDEYIEFIKWDSVFNPNYKILKIEPNDNSVKARISKIDTRIFFMHEAPIITDEVIHFKNDKIVRIESTDVVFNEDVFIKNKNEFLTWINTNHPELNGFINDQTEAGAIKFLRAINLYQNRKH